MQEHWQEKPIDGADGEVERALTALRPRLPSIDRDGLLFSAGFQSARRKLWLWRSATGSLAAMLLLWIFARPEMTPNPPHATGGSGNTLAVATKPVRPGDVPLERVRNPWVEVIWSSTSQQPDALPPQNYLAARQAVIDRGLGALPGPAERATQRSTLQDLLDLRLQEPGDPSVFKLIRRGGESL